MSYKLFPGGEGATADPIPWRPVGSPAAPPIPPRAPGNQANSNPQGSAGQPDLEMRLQEAFQKGVAAGRGEGEKAGAQRAAEQFAPVVASFQATIQSLATSGDRILHENEDSLVKLALAIARRILHREMQTDPEAILGLVRAAFAKLNARELHRLRLSPADARIVEQYRANLSLPPAVEIVADQALATGSAVFETTRGEMDASIQTQLDEIGRGLADLVHRHK